MFFFFGLVFYVFIKYGCVMTIRNWSELVLYFMDYFTIVVVFIVKEQIILRYSNFPPFK